MNQRAMSLKRGFSLVEVCLALLVVGLGLLSIFGLFPTGLAASEDAQKDTATGLFANRVMTELQVNADNWKPYAGDDIGMAKESWSGYINGAATTRSLMDDMAYVLTVADRGWKVKEVTLYAMIWKGTLPPPTETIKSKGAVFYSELYFTVLP